MIVDSDTIYYQQSTFFKLNAFVYKCRIIQSSTSSPDYKPIIDNRRLYSVQMFTKVRLVLENNIDLLLSFLHDIILCPLVLAVLWPTGVETYHRSTSIQSNMILSISINASQNSYTSNLQKVLLNSYCSFFWLLALNTYRHFLSLHV